MINICLHVYYKDVYIFFLRSLSDLTATVAYGMQGHAWWWASYLLAVSSCDHQGLEWFTADLLIGSLAPGQSRRGMWLFNIMILRFYHSIWMIWMVKLEYLQASSAIVQDGDQILACGWSLAHWPRRCSGRAAAGLAAGHRKNMMQVVWKSSEPSPKIPDSSSLSLWSGYN